MHNTPLFRQDLAATFGCEGTIARLDNFSNLVFTGLFDQTTLTMRTGGRAGRRARARSVPHDGGQQMGMMLGTLAHNLVVWAKRGLVAGVPRLKRYGVQRMVRDVMAVSGFLEMNESGSIKRVVMNKAAPLARQCAKCLHILLTQEQVRVILGETYEKFDCVR